MKVRSNSRLAVAALLIALVAMSVVLPAAAQAPRPMRHAVLPEPEAMSSEQVARVVSDSVRLPDGRVQVIVTLAGRPAVDDYVAAGGRNARSAAMSLADARSNELSAEQSVFATAARSVGAEVVNTHTFLTNTVTMAVHPDQVAALWRLPGVVNVSADRIFQRTDTTSVPLIGAPAVWAGTPGATGAGVKIGILDTGIDYTHTHFGGTGDYADAGDTTDAADGSAGLFPAAFPLVSAGAPKVIGGYDFVGDDYDASTIGSMPAPDGDPVDCPVADGGGHGSHVSGSAAGWGVNANGTTYTGVLNGAIFTSLPNVTTAFRIGPGVAPEAALVAIRIFGCDGSVNTDVLLDAIESAVTGDFPGTAGDVVGGLDVINMSLGSSYGGSYDDDPLVAAQEAATDAGLIIVDSAGNNANSTLITGAPGSANSVISVASTTDTTAVADALLVRNNGTGSPTSYFAQPGAANNANAIPHTDTVVVAVPANGCTALTNGAAVAGNTVLIIRGSCDFVVKQNNAFAAGADGVIVYNNVGDGLISMANTGINPAYDLPTYFIGQSDGEELVAEDALTPGLVSVTFDFGDQNFYATETADQISSFSSRGGVVRSVGDLTLKPNVAAPGNTIVSARAGTGNEFYVIGGTSMASPHVAGLAALMRELHPTLSVAEIKALIMNTANEDVTGAVPAVVHPPQRVGSGRVDAADAALSDVIAYSTSNPENVAVSFGYPKVLPGAPAVFTQTITIQNLGSNAYSLAAAYEALSDMGGVEVTVDAAAALAAGDGATTTITVTLTVDPSNATPNLITYDYDVLSASMSFLTEEAGNIVLTATGLPELRVPVYAAPHIASDMSASLSINDTYTIPSIDLNGIGVDTSGAGALGSSIVSLATAYELVADDGVDAPINYEPRPGDVYLQDDNAVDIDKVGITSDVLVQANPANGTAYIAITTFSEWTGVRDIEFDIYIDEDFDNVEDWILYNTTTAGNGLAVGVVDVNGVIGAPGLAYIIGPLNGRYGAAVDTILYKSNVMVFQFPLGLTLTGDFSYWIEVYSRDGDFAAPADTVASAAAPLYFNGLAPTYSFNDATDVVPGPAPLGLPLWFDLDNYAIPVNVHPDAEIDESLPDILVLHHHNQDPATRAQVLDSSILVDSLGGFELLTPANNSYILDPSSVTAATWEHVEGTDVTWRFVLTQISTNTRLGLVVDLPGLTPEVDADLLACDLGVCTLDASSLSLDDGQYSWTATYTDGLGVEHEASNAPFYFTIESNDLNLIANPGFEDCIGGVASSWSGTAKCKTVPAKANSGNSYFLGKAGRVLSQSISHPALLEQGSGDVLNFGGYFKTKANAAKIAMVKVTYTDDTKVKSKIIVTANTSGYELMTDTINLTGDVAKAKVKIGSKLAKVFADDLYLMTTGINGPEIRVDGILPPPAAPDGFRGNN